MFGFISWLLASDADVAMGVFFAVFAGLAVAGGIGGLLTLVCGIDAKIDGRIKGPARIAPEEHQLTQRATLGAITVKSATQPDNAKTDRRASRLDGDRPQSFQVMAYEQLITSAMENWNSLPGVHAVAVELSARMEEGGTAIPEAAPSRRVLQQLLVREQNLKKIFSGDSTPTPVPPAPSPDQKAESLERPPAGAEQGSQASGAILPACLRAVEELQQTSVAIAGDLAGLRRTLRIRSAIEIARAMEFCDERLAPAIRQGLVASVNRLIEAEEQGMDALAGSLLSTPMEIYWNDRKQVWQSTQRWRSRHGMEDPYEARRQSIAATWPRNAMLCKHHAFHGQKYRQQGSVLSCMGYRITGRHAMSEAERRDVLNYILYGDLPQVKSPAYMAKWGDPGTEQRFARLINALLHIAERPSLQWRAIFPLENDLSYLRRVFYETAEPPFEWVWPTTVFQRERAGRPRKVGRSSSSPPQQLPQGWSDTASPHPMDASLEAKQAAVEISAEMQVSGPSTEAAALANSSPHPPRMEPRDIGTRSLPEGWAGYTISMTAEQAERLLEADRGNLSGASFLGRAGKLLQPMAEPLGKLIRSRPVLVTPSLDELQRGLMPPHTVKLSYSRRYRDGSGEWTPQVTLHGLVAADGKVPYEHAVVVDVHPDGTLEGVYRIPPQPVSFKPAAGGPRRRGYKGPMVSDSPTHFTVDLDGTAGKS